MIALAGLAARLKRGVAFLAIVWGIAATFIAFEVIALLGTSVALGNPNVFGDLALPPAVSRSTVCEGPDTASLTGGPSALADAWLLGLAFGREALLRQQQSIATPQALAEMRTGVDESADKVGVPSPEAFVPRQIANAHREYIAFLEADGRQTARTLATRYSARMCQVYKLGAVWGYSEVGRIILPDSRSIFAIEIRYYSRQAGLPDELWLPMLEPQPSLSRAEVRARTDALTMNVTRHLAESR